ncbi:MAG: hypothetical protein ACKOQM_14855 [Novosphingobium sp.]
MSHESFIIAIVAIVVWGAIRLARIKAGTDRKSWGPRNFAAHLQEVQSHLPTAQTTAREKELQKEVEDLRERIHVLERIATDGRHTNNLAAEIESLRDR